MNNQLRELIDMATLDGTISEDHEKLILSKAAEQGVSEVEVNLYISNALRNKRAASSELPRESSRGEIKSTFASRETSDSLNNSINESQNALNWKDFKSYNMAQWILVAGTIIIAISGFFPWIESRASSSAGGMSFGSSASGSGGVFYSIPLAISALVFLRKEVLSDKKLYFGFGVALIALALALSYESKTSASGSGFSASASTNAGPGVGLLFLGGLAYGIGAVLEKSKDYSRMRRVLKIVVNTIVILMPFNILYSYPFQFVLLRIDPTAEISAAILPCIVLGALFFIRSNEKLRFYYFPMFLAIGLVIFDLGLRSINLFPREISQNEIISLYTPSDPEQWRSDNYDAIGIVQNTGWYGTNYWFAHDSHSSYKDSERCSGTLKSLAMAENIAHLLIALAVMLMSLPVVYRSWKRIAEITNFKWLTRILEQIRTFIATKLARGHVKNGSLSNYWIRKYSLLLVLFVFMRIGFSFAGNYYGYTENKGMFIDQVKLIVAGQVAGELGAAANTNVGNSQPGSSTGGAALKLSSLNASPCYIVNIAAVSTEMEAEQMARSLMSEGKTAGYLWIPDFKSLSGAQMFSVFLGPYYSQYDCEVATESIKATTPSAYGLLVSQEDKRVQINGIGKVTTNGAQDSQSQTYLLVEIIDPPSNVRSCASADCQVVDQCTIRGERVKLLSVDGEWTLIETNKGIKGYLHKTQFSASESKKLYTTVDKMNLRETPGFNADVITILPVNSSVEYLNVKSDFQDLAKIQGREILGYWYKVKTADGKIGWIHGCCISGI